MRTLHHQCPQLPQRQITSLISRAPRPHLLRPVLPLPIMAITTTGKPRKRTNPTASILPRAFLPNTTRTVTPFCRAFVVLSEYKSEFHPYFYISYSPPRTVMCSDVASPTAAARPYICEECGMSFARQHGSCFCFFSSDYWTRHSLEALIQT